MTIVVATQPDVHNPDKIGVNSTTAHKEINWGTKGFDTPRQDDDDSRGYSRPDVNDCRDRSATKEHNVKLFLFYVVVIVCVRKVNGKRIDRLRR